MKRLAGLRSRALHATAAAVSIAVGVAGASRIRAAFGYELSIGGAGTCRVWKNEPRAAVRARCGAPCASGGVSNAECPERAASRGVVLPCSWDCDVYDEKAVCYADGRVIEVGWPPGLVTYAECPTRRL